MLVEEPSPVPEHDGDPMDDVDCNETARAAAAEHGTTSGSKDLEALRKTAVEKRSAVVILLQTFDDSQRDGHMKDMTSGEDVGEGVATKHNAKLES